MIALSSGKSMIKALPDACHPERSEGSQLSPGKSMIKALPDTCHPERSEGSQLSSGKRFWAG